jgi:hypothetical protein
MKISQMIDVPDPIWMYQCLQKVLNKVHVQETRAMQDHNKAPIRAIA